MAAPGNSHSPRMKMRLKPSQRARVARCVWHRMADFAIATALTLPQVHIIGRNAMFAKERSRLGVM
jgi:hypothetical protein